MSALGWRFRACHWGWTGIYIVHVRVHVHVYKLGKFGHRKDRGKFRVSSGNVYGRSVASCPLLGVCGRCFATTVC